MKIEKKIGIVCSQFNKKIVDSLLQGALSTLKNSSVDGSQIDTVWVPGSFEIPFAASRMGKTMQYDGIITLGCIIQGETPHFDFISKACTEGVMKVGIDLGIPVILGILTTNTLEQAQQRAGINGPNHGNDYAFGVIDMIKLNACLEKSKG